MIVMPTKKKTDEPPAGAGQQTAAGDSDAGPAEPAAELVDAPEADAAAESKWELRPKRPYCKVSNCGRRPEPGSETCPHHRRRS